MRAVALLPALAAVLVALQTPRPIPLTSGLVIDRSIRVQPGRYRLASSAADRPAVVIRGDDITVDLTDVIIEGTDPAVDPDTFAGTGIAIEGSGVTVRGGAIRGFKVGILARRAPRLHITGTDVSYNWKPRLKSGVEQEDQSDWLSFHNNEKDEWLRYGAAIYLAESDDAEIDNARAVQGMNGLMVTRSSRLKIWNNTFSWLSGVGLGLYRTTDSRIMHNKLDWCVRGYSHGFYNRGQDSTGLLLYEQSSRNIVAFNSITHGGDGVFLWAGQSTMDTGEGGANDNMFYDNDVSHAVANGFELTFSRNTVVKNRIDDCWHGIWGGYSFNTVIADNSFDGNTEGIAIEHGQENTILRNTFSHEDTSIRLWANTSQDPNWGYPKHRDTRSRDYTIQRNQFNTEKVAVDVTRTSNVQLIGNQYRQVSVPAKAGDGTGVLSERVLAEELELVLVDLPSVLPGGMNAKLPAGARRGRDTIIVDDWGPYDYRSPKLWPAGKPGDRPLHLRVMGPSGRWTLSSIRGATAATSAGVVPAEIVVTPESAGADLAVDLEYRGAEVVTPRGLVVAAGQPYRFSYSLFDPAIDWTVRFWKFDASTDPLAARAAFESKLATSPPIRTETTSRLFFANARAFGEGYGDHIGIIAEGSLNLPQGNYQLAVTSDDGIRVWIDGVLVLEDWSIHGPKEDKVAIGGGAHRIRIEYFQNTGAAALIVKVLR